MLGNQPLQAVEVHAEACLGSELAGELEGQAIGVIQMEGHLGGDAVAALGPQPRELAPQLGGGATQRGLEPLASPRMALATRSACAGSSG
jgi:hypothetical protein